MEMKIYVPGTFNISTAKQEIKVKTTLNNNMNIYEMSISKSKLCKVNQTIPEFPIPSLFS